MKRKIDPLLSKWKEKGEKMWGKKCEICEAIEYIQGHHFYPYKKYKSLRYEPLNYIPLCRKHHFKLEKLKEFDIIYQIIINRGMKWLKELRKKL
jgi:hypothetical protein